MSTEKPTPSELTALWILMTAKTWGAAIGAIAEGEPQVVEMLAAHDREVAAKALRMQWVSVTDRLPNDERVVLLTLTGYPIAIGWLKEPPEGKEGREWRITSGHLSCESGLHKITHWMPLPSPPAQKEPKK